MRKRAGVQRVPDGPPVRKMLVEQGDEALVVAAAHEVRQFVEHDVFEALWMLARKLGIQAHGPPIRVRASPFGLHATDECSVRLHAQQGLPFGQDGGQGVLNLVSVPALQDFLPSLGWRVGTKAEDDSPVLQLDRGRRIVLDNTEKVALAPDVVGFALDVFARCFAGLSA